jgi:DNA-binding transcriptional ArsR family regulator
MARTSSAPTRHRTRRAAQAPATVRSLVRGQTGVPARYTVSFDARPAYDFVISLAVGGEDFGEIAQSDQAWLREAREPLRPAPGELPWVGTFESEGMAGLLTGLVVARPDLRTADDVVTAVDAAPASMLVQCLTHKGGGDEEVELMEKAAAGDREAARELERVAGAAWAAAAITLLRDPERGIEQLRTAVRAWRLSFARVEERVTSIIERDVAARRAEGERLEPGDLIERVTGGIRFVPDTAVRRVILAPSYFSRPFNWVHGGPDWRLFCYPVAEAAIEERDRQAPSAEMIRLYRTLGDESRLRILKLLVDHDMYLTEIAEALGYSKPTISHHMAQLRAAGLVSVTDQGNLTYYSLRRQRLEDISTEIGSFLG